jgi:cell pole-organizing protein PopZ
MSDTRGASADPSMEDILASIRKIISDDEARAGRARTQAAGEAAAATTAQDVLLLTDLIEEPGRDGAGAAGPPSRSGSAAGRAAPAAGAEPDPALVEAAVAGAASSAFERLDQAMRQSVPPPAAGDTGPALGPGGKTIEDLVKEMLRPMLKDWLDRNLPGIVERYVEREVVRLTRR